MTSPRLLWLPLATLTAYQKDPGSVKYFQNMDSSLVSFKSTCAVWPWQISRCVGIHAVKFGLFFFISHNSSYGKVMFSRACVCSQGRGEYPTGERASIPQGEGRVSQTPSGSHQNMYSWQADGTHPTGMLSCSICGHSIECCLQ